MSDRSSNVTRPIAGDFNRIWIVSDEEEPHPELLAAAKSFGVPVITTESAAVDADSLSNANEYNETVFIIDQFAGPVFQRLKSKRRILGPTALREIYARNEFLNTNHHPIFSFSMMDLTVVFTGFSFTETTKMVRLIRYMGGCPRNKIDIDESTTTHLVAKNVNTRKYCEAVLYGIPVMSDEWVYRCWEQRSNIIKASSPELSVYTAPIFIGLYICCFGFNVYETKDLNYTIIKNGGTLVEYNDEKLTHLILNPEYPEKDLVNVDRIRNIMKKEWIWECVCRKFFFIHDDFRLKLNKDLKGLFTPQLLKRTASRQYRSAYDDIELDVESLHNTGFLNILPTSANAKIATEHSDLHEIRNFNPVPLKLKIPREPCYEIESILDEIASSRHGYRTYVIHELLTTEHNYIVNLQNILQVQKQTVDPAEGGPILTKTESRIIFGNLHLIHKMHCQIFEELDSVTNSNTFILVGEALLPFCQDIRREYNSFLNFYEVSQSMLSECMKYNSRFRDLLNRCQNDPNNTPYFNKSNLHDMMLRVVQRLPSLARILRELSKRTDNIHPDKDSVDQSLSKICEILSYINQSRKLCEEYNRVLDMYYLIKNCPPSVASSSHIIVLQFRAVQMGKPGFSSKGDHLIFFVFNNMIEVCKIRSKFIDHKALASASQHQVLRAVKRKPYKHLMTVQLSDIREVGEIKNNKENELYFILYERVDVPERSYTIQLYDNTTDMGKLLATLKSLTVTEK